MHTQAARPVVVLSRTARVRDRDVTVGEDHDHHVTVPSHVQA
jgi:hypothetical protein